MTQADAVDKEKLSIQLKTPLHDADVRPQISAGASAPEFDANWDSKCFRLLPLRKAPDKRIQLTRWRSKDLVFLLEADQRSYQHILPSGELT